MKNTLHRLGTGAVAVLLATGLTTGSAIAAPTDGPGSPDAGTAGAGPAGAPTTAAGPNDVLLLTLPAAEAARAAKKHDLDIVSRNGDSVVVLGTATLANQLKQSGLHVSTERYETSLGKAGTASAPAKAAPAPVPAKLNAGDYDTYFGGYRTTGAYAKFATDLAAKYPQLVQHVDFGDSYLKTKGSGGHDLVAVRITGNVGKQPGYTDGQKGRPRFFLGAQTHSREIITSEMAWRFAAEVVDGYGKDPQITSLLDSTEVWVAFQHNPDSTEMVETAFAGGVQKTPSGDGNPAADSKAWQRKNQNASGFKSTGAPWSQSQPGVDLNRNWPYKWGGASTSSDPGSIQYRGASAGSEPEVVALQKLLTGLYGEHSVAGGQPAPKDRSGTYIHLHSYSNLVLQPFGYDRQAKVPNGTALTASAFRQSHGSNYATGKPGELLYDASGGDFDFVYGALGVPGFVYEIGTEREGGFFPAYSRADAYWKKVRPGLFYAAEAAYAPYTASLGGVVSELKAERKAGGAIAVTGAATDDAYGADPGSRSRRPAVTDITEVEVAAAADRAALDAGKATVSKAKVKGPGKTVEFDADVSGDGAGAKYVFARAKNGSGEFGPWKAVFVGGAQG